jgi:hypothetical protein
VTAIRAAQALAILDQLEKLPTITSIYIDKLPRGAVVTVVRVDLDNFRSSSTKHIGEDVTDALSQALTVTAHEEVA